jgi:hypothetical protein
MKEREYIEREEQGTYDDVYKRLQGEILSPEHAAFCMMACAVPLTNKK